MCLCVKKKRDVLFLFLPHSPAAAPAMHGKKELLLLWTAIKATQLEKLKQNAPGKKKEEKEKKEEEKRTRNFALETRGRGGRRRKGGERRGGENLKPTQIFSSPYKMKKMQ